MVGGCLAREKEFLITIGNESKHALQVATGLRISPIACVRKQGADSLGIRAIAGTEWSCNWHVLVSYVFACGLQIQPFFAAIIAILGVLYLVSLQPSPSLFCCGRRLQVHRAQAQAASLHSVKPPNLYRTRQDRCFYLYSLSF